jgi:hypothetical protein
LPRLRVSVRGLEGVRSEVRIDGRKLDDALVGVDNPLDPGTHRIEVTTPGRTPEVREVTLLEGDRKEVAIEVVALEATPAPEPVAPPAPPPVAEKETALGAPAIASFATAGAGVLLGTISGSIALGKRSDLEAACEADCPPSMRDTLSAYRLHRTLSYVGFGVALGGAALGSYFLLSGTDAETETSVSMGVSPASVLIRGRF